MNERKNIACRVVDGLQLRRVDESRGIAIETGERKQRPLESPDLSDAKVYQQFHPYLWSFPEAEWSIFGTLTWSAKGRRGVSFDSEILRRIDFNGLLSAACAELGIRRKHLPYYHAMEWTRAEEAHFHFLIARDERQKVPAPVLAKFLQDYWTEKFKPFDSMKHGAGTADVRAFDRAKGLRGLSYCLKRDFDFYGNERERFDEASSSLLTLLQKKIQPTLN
jgi:hypothetical protein